MEQQQQQQGEEQATTWADLVGKTYEEAEAAIKADRPDAQVEKVLEGSPVTRDFRPFRVRVEVDASGKVVTAPRTG
ncbi:chymotrypsin inhibitor [Aplysia californica]|uniref:Chymotrypsin inhibitor n=1 Tax=Aplysia californica TaxID=6500 RepID=A0ABM1AAW5_APLCA|nr:chymotrypsin inhibitor [Aplysia californica]